MGRLLFISSLVPSSPLSVKVWLQLTDVKVELCLSCVCTPRVTEPAEEWLENRGRMGVSQF